MTAYFLPSKINIKCEELSNSKNRVGDKHFEHYRHYQPSFVDNRFVQILYVRMFGGKYVRRKSREKMAIVDMKTADSLIFCGKYCFCESFIFPFRFINHYIELRNNWLRVHFRVKYRKLIWIGNFYRIRMGEFYNPPFITYDQVSVYQF